MVNTNKNRKREQLYENIKSCDEKINKLLKQKGKAAEIVKSNETVPF